MIKKTLLFLVALAVTTVFMGYFIPFVLDKADIESEWRKARVAKYYSEEQ